MTWVGRSIRRVEDPTLLQGAGMFVGDIGGAAAVRFVRSPVAHGDIRAVHGPAYTIEDLDADGVGHISAVLHRPDYVRLAQPLLARERVRYVGEPVAVVVADTASEAEDLAEQVELDIEPLPASVSLDAALACGAPLVHPEESESNVMVAGEMATPELVTALESAHAAVELEVVSGRQAALPLEARGSHAVTERFSGRTTLHASVQAPHMIRTVICDLLGMPESDLRVVAPDVGGGFGQKLPLAREDAVVVWLARRLGRAVVWIEDRSENLMASWHSREQRYRLRAGFDADARMTALQADIVANVGAWPCYPITWGVEPLMALAEMPGPYTPEHYGVRSRGIATHTCPMSPYRGVSRPAITLALERLMDTAAARLGLDPVEIRRRNLQSEFPHISPTGLRHDEGTYREAMELAAEHVDIPAFRSRQQAARAGGGPQPGIGICTFSERTGYGTPAFAARAMGVTPGYENVDLDMDPSGYVTVRIGASPHGQGLATALSQIIADEVGVTPDRVRVVASDTDRTPYGWGSFASRAMVLAGGATYLAAQKLATQLGALAGEILEAAADDVVLADGRATVAGTSVGVEIAELARIAHHHTQRLPEGATPGLSVQAGYDPGGTFSNACHIAEVEVDLDTGGVSMKRFVVAEDAGRLINPMIVDGQIRGGVAQGIANALLEEVVYDGDGNILTTSLMDYLPPTTTEIPDIEILHLETISDATVSGAKGVGEGGTIGAPAAVLNAVNDALGHLGVALNEMPATPERVRALVRAATDADVATAGGSNGSTQEESRE
jgi:carbon-monoxide dehydrogenase large subunit